MTYTTGAGWAMSIEGDSSDVPRIAAAVKSVPVRGVR
jgi:hypothetical protein